jgi:nitrate reductase beta subunit
MLGLPMNWTLLRRLFFVFFIPPLEPVLKFFERHGAHRRISGRSSFLFFNVFLLSV